MLFWICQEFSAPYWLENCRMSKFSGLPGRMSEEIPVYVSLYHPSWLSFWPYYYLEGNKQKIANFKVKYSGDTKNVHVLWSQINLFHFCCCEVASVASDSVRHHRWQPTRLPRPWDPPGKKLEWVAISFSNAWKWEVKVESLSCVRLLATPWTAAYQAPLSMGFSRQEYWSGLPLPSPC